MAIAGLHSVSVLDSSFLRDSHSQSSGRGGDGRRGSTRSSSLLQMWREIEDEHVVNQVQGRSGEVPLEQRRDGLVADLSREDRLDIQERGQRHVIEDTVLGENESETWSQSQSQNESHDGNEDLNNSSCENSSDLGEVERERVRQIFREWMNSGARDHVSNISERNNGSRGEWLGETEQERVRVIREWVQMSSQQRSVSSGENREEPSAEIDTQIERVRDGLIVNQIGGQTEHTRRGIRKLCGRQAMLDMLKKAERERQREIHELLDHRAVSQFPYRNRIQALLRGRFLRNDRPVDNNRPLSVAESELGFLRRRQTVSGLREGFFARRENSGCSQATSNASDTSSNVEIDFNTNEQMGSSSSHIVPSVHSEESDPNDRGSNGLGVSGSQNWVRGTTCENLHWQESTAQVDELQHLPIESLDCQSSLSADVERGDNTEQNLDVMPTEDNANEITQQSLRIEDSEHCNNEEFSEVHNEQSELGDINNSENYSSNYNIHMEDNVVNGVNWNESGALEGEQPEEVSENEGSEWYQNNTEWRNSTEENVDDNHLSNTPNEWPENSLGNEDGENSRLQESHEVWQEDGGFQGAVENWLGGTSDHESAPVGRIRGFYFPEDDNVYSVELRELLSRRSVSNLLGSSFRESLDQLIQSYVERQGHANIDWELQETTPSSASVEQDLEQQSRDQIVGQEEGTVNSPLNLPSLPIPPPLPIWDQHHHRDNWSQNDINNQHLDLEIINDLRIDMARLQQRMNNMQRMLEACMDMQLELQRSIRQEVSAALNRSAGSSGIHDCESPEDKSKWECVRKGLCCICCESNIDSLLYRCGHLCTCSKCANELLQSRRKCPMCQAPVVEVIRAYSIQ
ncbi:hypothetical protein AAZV13_11G152900 [Glycine max]|nr:E3 ubiquitin-protein ligase NEURL1B [Glycine max]KAH1225331.1 E3 ubiquitin-protein ligase NEURL1B [Glycine max]